MCLTHFSDVEIYGSIQGNCHFPVHFIIKAAPIRGKPSCAATWPQSFASAENADRRQIFKSRTLGGQLVFVLPVPCLTSSPQRGWRIRQITLLGDMSAAMVAGSRGAVSGGIWKWDNGSSFPSVTLLWEPPEGKRGRLTPSSSITSAFQGGWLWRGGLPSQWAHARKPKARPPELEESRSQDSRRGAPVTRAEPQSEAVARPFQSRIHLCC